jgi:hypothetical protein
MLSSSDMGLVQAGQNPKTFSKASPIDSTLVDSVTSLRSSSVGLLPLGPTTTFSLSSKLAVTLCVSASTGCSGVLNVWGVLDELLLGLRPLALKESLLSAAEAVPRSIVCDMRVASFKSSKKDHSLLKLFLKGEYRGLIIWNIVQSMFAFLFAEECFYFPAAAERLRASHCRMDCLERFAVLVERRRIRQTSFLGIPLVKENESSGLVSDVSAFKLSSASSMFQTLLV